MRGILTTTDCTHWTAMECYSEFLKRTWPKSQKNHWISSEWAQPKTGRIFTRFQDKNPVQFILFFPPLPPQEEKNGKNWTFHWEIQPQTSHTPCQVLPPPCHSPEFGRRRNVNLREGKSHQGPTDHNEVEDIPQVTEIGARVEQQPQVDHLQGKARKRKSFYPTWLKSTLPRGRRRFWIKGPITNCWDTWPSRKTLPQMKLKSIKPQPKAVKTRALSPLWDFFSTHVH